MVLNTLGVTVLLAACTTTHQRILTEAPEESAGPGHPSTAQEERVEEPQVAAPAARPPEAGAAQEAPAAIPAAPTASAVVEPPSPFMFDILFDFDRFDLREDSRDRVEINASRLRGRGGWTLLLEGRGDERGTAAYNLVLGERRAQTVKRYLESLGLDDGLIKTVSYGKDRPLCVEHSEACWAKNRSVRFSLTIADQFYQHGP